MTISRRIFLRSATMVALAETAQAKFTQAFGQKLGGKRLTTGTGFRTPAANMAEPFTYFTRSTFAAHLNSTFQVRQGVGSNTAIMLVEVNEWRPKSAKLEVQVGGRECFSLIFSCPKKLPQASYTVEHGALGTFSLLLVPTGKQGEVTYLEAVINRLV